MRIVAPAKLNLFLHITGKRPDGYHLLESLAAFTSFGDVLEIAPANALSLEVSGPFAAAVEGGSESNLVLRAAKALQEHAGISKGAHISLHKHIPVGAGLGGGSSDAAAALIALSSFWQLSLDKAALHSISAPLGSDIAVCLLRKPAWVTGAGEHVTPVSFSGTASVVMVNPRVPLLTADVYRQFRPGFTAPVAPPPALRTFDALVRYLKPLGNVLETPAVALQPMIRDMLVVLAATEGCALARMSGSGATCFALYEDAASAKNAAHALRRAHAGWWIQESELSEGV